MSGSADILLETLTFLPIGDDVFAPAHYPRREAPFVFGGQLLAQAMRAASLTVDADRVPNSLHAHFLAAGRPADEMNFAVRHIRDGGSFSTRQVEARHGEATFFEATVSFNRVRPSNGVSRPTADYQLPAPSAPGPDDAIPWDVQMGRGESIFGAFEMREFPVPEPEADGRQSFSRRLWFRALPEWPDDATMAACGLAFASDLGVTTAASVTEGLYPNAAVLSSLDHGLWLHRPTDIHEWHLLDLVSVSNSASRGVVRGSMHRLDGTLVASLMQETLIR